MGFETREGERLVEAKGAGAAKAQDSLAGPRPEAGEHGASGSGSSPSQCDEPMGDHGSSSVYPSPRLPCSSAAIDEADERDAEEQAAIASIILQLSQQPPAHLVRHPPASKRRRVRNSPGGAHGEHQEGYSGRHGVAGGSDRRRPGDEASGARASAVSQPPTPQPPPSTPLGGPASIAAFANFPDPVRNHQLPLPHGCHAQIPPLPQLTLSEGIQGNILPAIVTKMERDAMQTHLPPPADGVFLQGALTSASTHPSLYPFPGTLTSVANHHTGGAVTRAGSGGGNSGDASSGEQTRGTREGSGMRDDSEEGTPRDGGDNDGCLPAGGGGSRSAEVRRPYRCSKCGAEKKGHLCSAKLPGTMTPATPVKRVDLAARLAARLHAGAEGGEGMEVEGFVGLQANDLSHLPFFRSFRMPFLGGRDVLAALVLCIGAGLGCVFYPII
jgi:hypothetical protein